MNLEQALGNIELVLRSFKGTAEEHEVLKACLDLVKKELNAAKK